MIKSKSDESGSATMKQLLSLFLVLSLTACAAGPHASTKQTVLAAEESYTAPAQKAEHDPDARPPLEPTLPSPKPASPEASPPDASSPEPPTLAETEEALPPQRVVDPSRPMVALTFDDGPHAEYTDQILDILEEHQTVATFFEVAVNLHRDPDAVRRAVDMGCEIGSHSYRHADLGKMSQEAIQADLAAADELFTQVLGQAPTLLRPPYGSINQALKTSSGRALVTWSIDTEDWLNRNTEKIVSSVQNFGDLDGQVILLHSIYDTTVEATRILVPWLLEQGYQLVTVSELLTLRFRQEVQANHLYGYSLFRWQVPPLAETPVTPEAPEVLSAEPVSKAPIKVKLVLRETVPGESVRTELLGKDLLSLQARRL